ncbi:MAG: hypothetical protein AB7N76_09250 [Planctomycetota bacterium]
MLGWTWGASAVLSFCLSSVSIVGDEDLLRTRRTLYAWAAGLGLVSFTCSLVLVRRSQGVVARALCVALCLASAWLIYSPTRLLQGLMPP